jgi:hypothetical protein
MLIPFRAAVIMQRSKAVSLGKVLNSMLVGDIFVRACRISGHNSTVLIYNELLDGSLVKVNAEIEVVK